MEVPNGTGVGWDARLRTWNVSRVRAGRVCQFPHIPSSAEGASRTHKPRGLNPRGLPVAVTPAWCAARDLNPDPLSKSQLHNHSCSRRLEPHAGIEPASSAWKAGTLAVVLVRHGGSCGARTRGLRIFSAPLCHLS
jgi:hypothetical protein